jgi:hypothetical protein
MMQRNSTNRAVLVRWKAALLALCVVPGLLVSGCYVAPVTLAPSTIPLTPGTYTELGETSGSAFAVFIFGIPLSEPDPAGRARDRAIADKSADALVNVSADNILINLSFIGFSIARVHGTAVKKN